MTLNEFTLKLEQKLTVDNSVEEIVSIGSVSGFDNDCEFIIHLENGEEIKL